MNTYRVCCRSCRRTDVDFSHFIPCYVAHAPLVDGYCNGRTGRTIHLTPAGQLYLAAGPLSVVDWSSSAESPQGNVSPRAASPGPTTNRGVA